MNNDLRNVNNDDELSSVTLAPLDNIPNIPDQYYKDGYTTPFLR
ncbi:18210_t:CDS:1, partial [Rhizophagus irregularis]